VLFVRVATPTALETLIREIRTLANVATRTTVVLPDVFERRARPPVKPADGNMYGRGLLFWTEIIRYSCLS